MARFPALMALFVAGTLLAFAASASAAAPLTRDATSAPRLDQRRRSLREAEGEFVNAVGAVGEAYGEALGDASYLGGQGRRRSRSRSLHGAELVGEAGEAFGALGEAGEAFGALGEAGEALVAVGRRR